MDREFWDEWIGEGRDEWIEKGWDEWIGEGRDEWIENFGMNG